jgi:hypothetical protein
VLCFLSRRLLSEKHGVRIAGALVTIKVAVVDREELGRSVRGYRDMSVVVVVVVVCDL